VEATDQQLFSLVVVRVDTRMHGLHPVELRLLLQD
jgi:hypothetical protein